VQAGAAARVLDTDPAFVARALEAIAEAGRAALTDLDHALGVLRDGADAPRDAVPDLRDLDALVDRTGAAVRRTGEVRALPVVVSREAYRIVQEALTNAVRHGGGRAEVAVRAGADAVEVEVRNPLSGARPRPGGGRGVAGMRERVAVLGGELRAGAEDGTWLVRARIPVAPGGAP
jgi:signal transduction histidine kinase